MVVTQCTPFARQVANEYRNEPAHDLAAPYGPPLLRSYCRAHVAGVGATIKTPLHSAYCGIASSDSRYLSQV